MTSIYDFFKTKFLEKAQEPYALRLEFMNELRDVAVQASMYSFVAKEANDPDKIREAKEKMGEIASIIATICPEFLILSRHWKDIQKYPLLRQKWSKREVYKQYKRALKKNNNQYSTEAVPELIMQKIAQAIEQGLAIGLRSYEKSPITQIFEAIEKKILHIKQQHSIASPIQTKELLQMLNPPKLTDKELLIPPDLALSINPFTDLFWVTVCQIVYLEYAYYSYMLKQLSAPERARPYLWLGTVQVHVANETEDIVIKREEKKKTNRQKIKLTVSEVINAILKEDKAVLPGDYTLYIDHEGVKTNRIENLIDIVEKSLLDGQPSFTNTNFDYWCLCPPGSICDEWRSPYILDIEGFFYNPVVECWSTNNQAKPYLQFTFEWEKKQRVLAITKFIVQPHENVKIRINYEIKKEVNNATEWVEAGYIDMEEELVDKRAILPESKGARITVETIESEQNPLTLTFYGATVMKVKI